MLTREWIDACCKDLESPIEKELLCAIVENIENANAALEETTGLKLNEKSSWYTVERYLESPLTQELEVWHRNLFIVWPQHQINNFRVDFLIGMFGYHVRDDRDNPQNVLGVQELLVRKPLVVLECDGHDFHERTKEQARKDRSRDRYMLAAGYPVLRFTGSEIHADSARCARELVDFIYFLPPAAR